MSTERAKKLRANSTVPERRMWRLLHVFRTDGFHFRKQSPIGPYYADIACHHAKLVIEVDGDTHGTSSAERYDAARDTFLQNEGYTVLRFTNDDVLTNPDGVFEIVADALKDRPRNQRTGPTPSPSLPTRGRVKRGAVGTIPPTPRSSTSPLVGEDGRGVGNARRSGSEVE